MIRGLSVNSSLVAFRQRRSLESNCWWFAHSIVRSTLSCISTLMSSSHLAVPVAPVLSPGRHHRSGSFVQCVKEALQGVPHAQFDLAQRCSQGDGLMRSDEEAAAWYRRASEHGDVEAENNLGVMYLQGKGVAQSDAEAMRRFESAAAQGNEDATRNIELMKRKFHECQTEASTGSAGGQYKLGRMYFDGILVAQNDARALEWIRKAADQRHPESVLFLGFLHQAGRGTQMSYAKAFLYYQQAVDAGCETAYAYLGALYRDGVGVEQSVSKAITLFETGAHQGRREAQYELGLLYLHGKGVDQSTGTAAKLFLQAAVQGLDGARRQLEDLQGEEAGQAQFELACVYETDQGAGARKWYTAAAQNGHRGAQEVLNGVGGIVFGSENALKVLQSSHS